VVIILNRKNMGLMPQCIFPRRAHVAIYVDCPKFFKLVLPSYGSICPRFILSCLYCWMEQLISFL
jgi:hypothetical protein